MNYIGSKLRLSSWIKDEIKKVVGENLEDKTFCDIFAGTGIVGRAFKAEVKSVLANDLEYYSYVLNRNYIGNHKEIKSKDELLSHLNSIKLIDDGFIYKNYSLGGGSGRQYFSDENAKKIDAIRQEIERLKKSGEIDEDSYFFLLASLIESSDEVANTASIYGAFLKHLKKTAQEKFVLKAADFEITKNTHKVYNEDANTLIKKIDGDILYLDPPYNYRQYGANYHLLNTIAKYEEFSPKGKTGLPRYNRSNYSKKGKVLENFEALIKYAEFKYIFLSYNNEGLMSEKQIVSVMKKYGKYDLIKKEYKRFKADKTQNRNHKADKTYEYLHILEKRI